MTHRQPRSHEYEQQRQHPRVSRQSNADRSEALLKKPPGSPIRVADSRPVAYHRTITIVLMILPLLLLSLSLSLCVCLFVSFFLSLSLSLSVFHLFIHFFSLFSLILTSELFILNSFNCNSLICKVPFFPHILLLLFHLLYIPSIFRLSLVSCLVSSLLLLFVEMHFETSL